MIHLWNILQFSNSETTCFWCWSQPHLEFGILADNHLCQVWDGAGVHHQLGKLRCVFADVAERRGGNAFEGQLRLRETHHQQGDSSCIHDRLRQSCAVAWWGGEVVNANTQRERRFMTVQLWNQMSKNEVKRNQNRTVGPSQASCWAMQLRAEAAASFTPELNSSRHRTSASTPPQPTTAWDSSGECLATARSRKAADFL